MPPHPPLPNVSSACEVWPTAHVCIYIYIYIYREGEHPATIYPGHICVVNLPSIGLANLASMG